MGSARIIIIALLCVLPFQEGFQIGSVPSQRIISWKSPILSAKLKLEDETTVSNVKTSLPRIRNSNGMEEVTLLENFFGNVDKEDVKSSILSRKDEAEISSDADTFLLKDALILVGLCWGVRLLSALDRVAMSVALLPMSSEFGFSESMKGSISSLFSVGYGLFILPCGFLVSRASPKGVMAGGIFVWSASTVLTPIAAGSGFGPLLVARTIMGAAESVVLPTVNKLLVNWIPPNRKSLSIATVVSGFSTGTVLAYLLSPIILENIGWKSIFFVYGAIGFFWIIPWLLFAQDIPPTSTNAVEDNNSTPLIQDQNSKSFVNLLRVTVEEAVDVISTAPLKEMCRSKSVQAMAIAHSASNWGLYNNLAWSPTFYADQYGLNVKESALFSILPPIAGAISGIAAASVADRCIESGFDLSIVRRVAQGLGFVGPALFLLTLANDIPVNPSTAQGLLTVNPVLLMDSQVYHLQASVRKAQVPRILNPVLPFELCSSQSHFLCTYQQLKRQLFH